jgi:hypothetical protein
MRLLDFRSWAFVTTIVFLSNQGFAQEPASIDAEWLVKGNTEGAAILSKYQALLAYLDETNEARVEPERAGRVLLTTNHSVRLGENTLLEEGRFFADPKLMPRISLNCDNPDYYFGLQKSRQDGPFAMTEYAKGDRKVPLWKQSGALHADVYYQLKSGIEALAPGNRADLRTVRFDPASMLLIIERAGKKKTGPFIARFAIDPAQGWLVKQLHHDTAEVSTVIDYTYGKVIDKLTFPTGSTVSTTVKAKIPNAPPFSRLVIRVLELKRTDKVAADFRLSAFGLPEPAGIAVPPRPTRWYIWILVAAVACIVLAIGFAYLRRRLSGRRAAIPGGAI